MALALLQAWLPPCAWAGSSDKDARVAATAGCQQLFALCRPACSTACGYT